jgi:hypothetical protein
MIREDCSVDARKRRARTRWHIFRIDPRTAWEEEKNYDDHPNTPTDYSQALEPA